MTDVCCFEHCNSNNSFRIISLKIFNYLLFLAQLISTMFIYYTPATNRIAEKFKEVYVLGTITVNGNRLMIEIIIISVYLPVVSHQLGL